MPIESRRVLNTIIKQSFRNPTLLLTKSTYPYYRGIVYQYYDIL